MKKAVFFALIFVFSLGAVFAPFQGALASSHQTDWCRLEGNQADFVWDKNSSEYGTVTIDGARRNIVGGLVPCGRSCDDPTTEINEAADCGFCSFFYLLKNVMDWILKFVVTSLAALLIIAGGFILATSRGNPGQSQKGKDILIWTFAGLAVILVGWMVVNSLFAGLGVVEWDGVREGWWQFSCGT